MAVPTSDIYYLRKDCFLWWIIFFALLSRWILAHIAINIRKQNSLPLFKDRYELAVLWSGNNFMVFLKYTYHWRWQYRLIYQSLHTHTCKLFSIGIVVSSSMIVWYIIHFELHMNNYKIIRKTFIYFLGPWIPWNPIEQLCDHLSGLSTLWMFNLAPS